jgi:hypothetical protein
MTRGSYYKQDEQLRIADCGLGIDELTTLCAGRTPQSVLRNPNYVMSQ